MGNFKMNEKDFELILKTGDVEKTREKIRDRLIDSIEINPEIITGELAEIPEITVKGCLIAYKKLKEEGIIKRVGSVKSKYWEVIE